VRFEKLREGVVQNQIVDAQRKQASRQQDEMHLLRRVVEHLLNQQAGGVFRQQMQIVDDQQQMPGMLLQQGAQNMDALRSGVFAGAVDGEQRLQRRRPMRNPGVRCAEDRRASAATALRASFFHILPEQRFAQALDHASAAAFP